MFRHIAQAKLTELYFYALQVTALKHTHTLRLTIKQNVNDANNTLQNKTMPKKGMTEL